MTVNTSGMSLNLAWITVNDFDKAVSYYTKVLGLEVIDRVDEMGWAELRGEDGATLGIAKAGEGMPAGVNAVPAFNVENLVKAKAELATHGVSFEGDIVEIPGHVKMQLCRDPDGNLYHVCENLEGK